MKASRPRWPLLGGTVAVVVLAACSVISHAAYPYRPAGHVHSARPHSAPPHSAPPLASALPDRAGAYWGVFEPGTPDSYEPVQRFTALMGGEAPRIVLYFSDWGEPFRTAYARAARNHRAQTLVQIEPSNVNLADIASGRFDGYLRSFAGQVRAFGSPVIIGFAHEMNGGWYSWGAGHVPPGTWIAAWRHLVTVFRQQGADNVTWLWTVNITGPQIPSPRQWWPGGNYVTWVGIDGYYWAAGVTFRTLLSPTITAVQSFTRKPILIAETGISYQDVPATMPGLVAGILRRHLLGLVWFDDNGREDWRLEGHPAAVTAFRRAVTSMLALSR